MLKFKYIKVNYQKKYSEGSGDATKNDMITVLHVHSLSKAPSYRLNPSPKNP